MRVEVRRSAVIEAPIDRVWNVLRDFGGYDRWHPEVTDCLVENDLDGDVVGCVRHYRLGEEIEFREQLLRHGDSDRSYAYAILDSPLPVFDNVTTITLKPVTDSDRTFLNWSARFRTSTPRAKELEDLVGRRIFEAGFTGLRSFLADEVEPSVRVEAELEKPALVAAGEPLPGRVIVLESIGGPEVMAVRDIMVPAADNERVRVRLKAVAVNHIDLLYRRGLAPELDLPGTPGLEGVGEIIDVGERVNGLFPGDRVAWVSRSAGSYGELRLVNARECVPLPDDVSDLEASTLFKGLTAGLLLGRIFRAAVGNTILIESAAGGLGHILCQWAAAMELNVIGTVSSDAKARFARDHGCNHPLIPVRAGEVRDEVMRITNGRGVDFVAHDGRSLKLDEAAGCLARFGHLASIGDGGGSAAVLKMDLLRQRSLTISAHDCLEYFGDPLYLQRSAHHYFTRLRNRTVIPVVESMPLSRASEAHRKLETRQNMGVITLIADN
jgi:NADPH:quinone reductase